MSDVQRLKARILTDPKARAAYEAFQPELELLDVMLEMRQAAGLSQSELAERMNKNKGNLSRMEKPGANPTWSSIQNYAEACGFQLEVGFTPKELADQG